MSLTPIWSLAARRHELGGATKGVIYLSKIAIGAAVAGFVFVWSQSLATTVWTCAGVFVTSKVCWFVNTGTRPFAAWDELADWSCDGALHFAWLAIWLAAHGHTGVPLAIALLWLASYPWSSE